MPEHGADRGPGPAGHLLGGGRGTLLREHLAGDAVIEVPFASPGQPRRFDGREEFLAYAGAQRAALPVRFEDCQETAIHDTADPEVIVGWREYQDQAAIARAPGGVTGLSD